MTFKYDYLFDVTMKILGKMGCPQQDAEVITDVLLKGELRAISSHGLLRIKTYYDLWQKGRINSTPDLKIVHETPSTAVIDGDRAFGMVAAKKSMDLAIEKARVCGSGWVATRNSNHFGIAGYYSMLALEHDMIGITMTNANASVAPTFSLERMLGTNPIAFAVPAGKNPPFVADFATTPVARGKIDIREKKGEKIPFGYIQDKDGNPTDNPSDLRLGGAILPLGGTRELGSNKGYCLGSIVDILSGVMSGAGFGPFVPALAAYLENDREKVGEGTGHFFGAIRIDGFMPADEFRTRMDKWMETFRSSRPSEGNERVLIPGDPEREAEERLMREGIELVPQVAEEFKGVADELGVDFRIG
ncbi:MAG: Ldh family oxidoreductase [Marinilabiliaceae bacterium]|jgi:LDH2 family malate/lactate/ureidoglycolate dehydrogenase|nr:Ldh family oxidoreductase [Marinilabiliaceae bacterium]